MASGAASAAAPPGRHARAQVLVVGAGFAGAALAIELAKQPDLLDVTLVDRRAFFEVVFANARTLVEPGLAEESVIDIADLKPHGTFVLGEVAHLEAGRAVLADGSEIAFDYAAVCTGASQAFGKASQGATTAAERRAELRAQHDALKAAPAVVVVGGGALGVELAAEVLTDIPGKPVFLVHGGERLLESLPPRAGRLALRWLENHGGQVLSNDRLVSPPPQEPAADGSAASLPGPGSLVTRGGKELPAGALVLWATGTQPATDFMRPALADALDGATQRIKVGPTLQVAGHPHLFALGDASDVPEEKLAFLARAHASVAAANIAALAEGAAAARAQPGGGAPGTGPGPAAPKLAVWKPGMGVGTIMLVSLGRSNGIAHLVYVTFGGWLVSKLKDLRAFVRKTRGELCAVPVPAAPSTRAPAVAGA